jgi:hypothetical protein
MRWTLSYCEAYDVVILMLVLPNDCMFDDCVA